MLEETKITEILHNDLINSVMEYKNNNFRLVQICSTRTSEGFELTYTFAKEYNIEHLRIQIDKDTEILSISNVYPPAFLYENEMKDLFGIKIKLISTDYNGNFYRIKQKQPYND